MIDWRHVLYCRKIWTGVYNLNRNELIWWFTSLQHFRLGLKPGPFWSVKELFLKDRDCQFTTNIDSRAQKLTQAQPQELLCVLVEPHDQKGLKPLRHLNSPRIKWIQPLGSINYVNLCEIRICEENRTGSDVVRWRFMDAWKKKLKIPDCMMIWKVKMKCFWQASANHISRNLGNAGRYCNEDETFWKNFEPMMERCFKAIWAPRITDLLLQLAIA